MQNDDSSLNLEEDLQEIKGKAQKDTYKIQENDLPQDFSLDNSVNQRINSVLDSQNDLNRAIIVQNSLEKMPTSKKEIENHRFLSEIEEDHELTHNQNQNIKENIYLDEQIKSGNTCGWCSDDKGAACVLI